MVIDVLIYSGILLRGIKQRTEFFLSHVLNARRIRITECLSSIAKAAMKCINSAEITIALVVTGVRPMAK
jgi:hypothetical protein